MNRFEQLLLENKAWVQERLDEDAEFFIKNAKVQKPEFLWIGCADSRVSPTEITQAEPGEVFIHRNITNVVSANDTNLLSVLQYAVEVLEINHIIVCGHYGCGGIKAALANQSMGLIDMWLRQIKDTYCLHKDTVDSATNEEDRMDRMVEANVIQQVKNVAKTSIVQSAWKKRKAPAIHGWVYDMSNGVLCPQLDILPGDVFDDPIYNYSTDSL